MISKVILMLDKSENYISVNSLVVIMININLLDIKGHIAVIVVVPV